MTIIHIDVKKLLDTIKKLEARCRQREARIALLENALTVAKLNHRDDEQIEKFFHELMNDDYRPDQIDLAKSIPLPLAQEQESN